MPIKYPPTRAEDFVEELHGVQVPDPYRWMEDLDSDELRQWIEAQNELTFDLLDSSPLREEIRERMTTLWNYEKVSAPVKRAGRYFYFYNDGLQNQDVLYWMGSLENEPKVLIDPNTLSEDGTVALSGAAVSPDGKYLAYGIADAGSDWQTWHVRRVDDAVDTDDLVEWVKFSGASWDGKSEGFFYSRYDAPEGEALKQANYFHKLYYHKLGTDQSEDKLIYDRPDQKGWLFWSHVSEDGHYLIINVSHGTAAENANFILDLTDPAGEVVELLPDFDAEYLFVGNDGPRLYFRTDRDAPQQRLVAIDLAKPEPADWVEIIPEAADKLEFVDYVGGRLSALICMTQPMRSSSSSRMGHPMANWRCPDRARCWALAGGVMMPRRSINSRHSRPLARSITLI